MFMQRSGYGLSCDAYHMTASDSDGIEKVILKALKDADIKQKMLII